MTPAPVVSIETYGAHQLWTAADRVHDLITSGTDEVSFSRSPIGFVITYQPKLALVEEPST